MTVLNTLILHLKSFKGLGRKKIFLLINDNINIDEITSSNVKIETVLDELYPKVLKYIPNLEKEAFKIGHDFHHVDLMASKIRISNIFEHRLKIKNCKTLNNVGGYGYGCDPKTDSYTFMLDNKEMPAHPGLPLDDRLFGRHFKDDTLFERNFKNYDLPIQIFALEQNGHLSKVTKINEHTITNHININFAIIGTRNPKLSSIEMSYEISKFLVTEGIETIDTAPDNISIVSGLAKGIDTAAHKGCLDGNGHTLAVVGHGLDTIYPKENRELAKKIIKQKGTIISEYPFGAKAERFRLIERDRIQALLSYIVILIESDVDGGSMHTIEAAKKMGREIWCYDIPASGNQKVISENKDIIIFKNFEEFKDKYFQCFEEGWPETQPWFEEK